MICALGEAWVLSVASPFLLPLGTEPLNPLEARDKLPPLLEPGALFLGYRRVVEQTLQTAGLRLSAACLTE